MQTSSKTQRMLQRLDEIGGSLAQSDHALALIGLGSAGAETDRMDEYSDIDFFAIVEPGYKQSYIQNIDWLSKLGPIAYHFLNTDDGYKLLYSDGVFCEFAVFEPDELQKIPFTGGRLIWKRADAPEDIVRPIKEPVQASHRTKEFLIGEAITNLYVGMGRDHRGEKLTAMRFIQGYAVDRLAELAAYIETEQNVTRDPFSGERRFEWRFPDLAQELPTWVQGYERNRESALAILAFVEKHFEVNATIASAIRELCA